MYLLIALTFTTLVCACAWVWLQGKRTRNALSHLPTFPRLPFIGNIHYFSGGGEVVLRRLLEMTSVSDEKNLPFLIWIGMYPALMFNDPDDIMAVTNAFVDKPYYYKFARVWMGNGLVTAPVSIWKRSVKKLAGKFSRSVVEGYQPVFNAQAQKLVARLRARVGSGPFDVITDLAYTTLETICQTALGVPRFKESIVTDEYFEAHNRVLKLLTQRGLNLVTHSEAIFKLTPAYRELRRSLRIIHGLSKDIISKRRKEWDNIRTNAAIDNEKPKFTSILDILLELSENDPHLTPQQIQDDVDTIIVGGHETGAYTLMFTLLMLGCKPQVQEKLYDELWGIFGDSDRPVEKEDLPRMCYSEAVLLESLRLFPPVPAVMRLADKDLKLKSCLVPKGTGCIINAYGMGRSKSNWGADALEFRPERWLMPTPPYVHSAAFLAFSYGRRACIGKKYAMSLLKTLLATCVREFQFSSKAEQLQLKFDLALRPISGHYVQVHPRTKREVYKTDLEQNPN